MEIMMMQNVSETLNVAKKSGDDMGRNVNMK
jgi:hypothetical protein